jgi:hypothetical protein
MIDNRDGNELTDGVFDTQSVELRLGKTAPNLRFVDFSSIFNTAIQRHDMFHQDVDSHSMILVFLVDEERFLVQAVLGCDLRNLFRIVVLKFINIANNLALVGTDGSEHKQILEVFILVERRRLKDDFLQQLNELNGKVGGQESFNSDRHIVRVSALWKGRSNDLWFFFQRLV